MVNNYYRSFLNKDTTVQHTSLYQSSYISRAKNIFDSVTKLSSGKKFGDFLGDRRGITASLNGTGEYH